MTLTEYLSTIAEAIRSKKGTTEAINAQSFAAEIAGLPTGGGESDSEIAKALIQRTIAEYEIPQGVTKIGNGAFSYCSSLSAVTIPEGVLTVGGYAFQYCTSLKSITFPSTVSGELGVYALDHCTALEELNLGYGIWRLTVNSLAHCTNLREFDIPASVTRIEGNALYNCIALSRLTLPASITIIGGNPFTNCTSLEFVTLGEGWNCNSLILSSSTLYSVETLTAMLAALADRTGQTAYRLTLGATNTAKLTDEQIAVATAKNWTLA